MTSETQATARGPIYFEEPRAARWFFGSSRAAWIWLIARLWLGWEWLQSGWGKVFGGDLTLRFWQWGDPEYAFTGDGNMGWVRAGPATSGSVTRWPGSRLARSSTLAGLPPGRWRTAGTCPFWSGSGTPRIGGFGPMVAIGELVIGVLLILGSSPASRLCSARCSTSRSCSPARPGSTRP